MLYTYKLMYRHQLKYALLNITRPSITPREFIYRRYNAQKMSNIWKLKEQNRMTGSPCLYLHMLLYSKYCVALQLASLKNVEISEDIHIEQAFRNLMQNSRIKTCDEFQHHYSKTIQTVHSKTESTLLHEIDSTLETKNVFKFTEDELNLVRFIFIQL